MGRGLGIVVLALGAACATAEPSSRARPEHALPMPDDADARRRVLARAGRRIYDALAAGRPERLQLDDMALRRLLSPEAASRASALRTGLGKRLAVRPAAFTTLATAHYAGVCVQGSRLEPAGSPVGLREPGWIVDRVLVAGRQDGGRRVAAWVEGELLYTNVGFWAISLGRVEEPRWEHSDLELAPCDMEVGLRAPRDVVGVTG
ncbi:MAG: hypothetical protein ACODAU_02205 [Myxococcota bacterium]